VFSEVNSSRSVQPEHNSAVSLNLSYELLSCTDLFEVDEVLGMGFMGLKISNLEMDGSLFMNIRH